MKEPLALLLFMISLSLHYMYVILSVTSSLGNAQKCFYWKTVHNNLSNTIEDKNIKLDFSLVKNIYLAYILMNVWLDASVVHIPLLIFCLIANRSYSLIFIVTRTILFLVILYGSNYCYYNTRILPFTKYIVLTTTQIIIQWVIYFSYG